MRRALETQLPWDEQALDVALQVVEIDVTLGEAPLLRARRTIGDRGELERLVYAAPGERALGDARVCGEHAPQFECTPPALLAVEVVAHVGDEAAGEAGAHHRVLHRDRIQEPHRRLVAAQIAL